MNAGGGLYLPLRVGFFERIGSRPFLSVKSGFSWLIFADRQFANFDFWRIERSTPAHSQKRVSGTFERVRALIFGLSGCPDIKTPLERNASSTKKNL